MTWQITKKNPPPVALQMVDRLKKEADLGVQNLALHNTSQVFQSCWPSFGLVWKSHYSHGIPPKCSASASSWWRDSLKLIYIFNNSATCNMHNGKSILFWKDNWRDNQLHHEWPHLFSFAINKDATVAEILQCNDKTTLVQMPPSIEAFDQFQAFMLMVDQVTLDHNHDTWSLKCSLNGFRTTKIYLSLIDHLEIADSFKWLWKSCRQLKHNFFSWFWLFHRLNTWCMLQNQNFNLPSHECILSRESSTWKVIMFSSIAHLFRVVRDIYVPNFHQGKMCIRTSGWMFLSSWRLQVLLVGVFGRSG